MRFGLVHRIMIDLLATLGLLSLVTSGELNPWITGSIVFFLVVAFLIPERYQDHKRLRQFGMIASLGLLATQVTRLILGGEVLNLAVEFAAALQVIRLLTRRGAVYDQQIILLALIHLIAGTVLGGGLAYGLCFLGFLVAAPGALVLSHLRREVEGNYRQGARDRTGLPVDVPRILRSRRVISKRFLLVTCSLSIPVFIFTAFLFVLFPRVGLSLLLLNQSHTQRMVGFSDHVDLGGVGKLRTDPTIALRVYPEKISDSPPLRLALYLRGTAFDTYNGRTWSRTVEGRYPARQSGSYVWLGKRGISLGPATMTIDLEPITPPVIFIPRRAQAIQVLSRGEPLMGFAPTVLSGPEGQLEYNNIDDRGIRYRVFEDPTDSSRYRRLARDEQLRYLTLPPDFPERIGALARQWVGSTSDPFQMAQIIEQHLQTEYRYDLDSPSGAAQNPLDHFLFESKSGHCEFYSTALALLLRTLGVPTRNVTGFIGGSYNRFGDFYAVRQGDAHSWVEVYIDNRGWLSFDPTPPSSANPQTEVTGLLATVRDLMEAASQRWNRHIVGYDLQQQVHLLRSVGERYVPFSFIGDHRLTPAEKRRMSFAALGIVLALGLIFLWHRGGKKHPFKHRPSPEELATIEIVALYKSLEAAMSVHGIARPVGSPPLAHARALMALQHPMGEEVLALTKLYIEARFGAQPLHDAGRRNFQARVKALVAQKRGTGLKQPRYAA